MSNKKELIEKRAKVIMDAQRHVAESKNWGAEEEARHMAMLDEAQSLQKRIDAMDKSDEMVAGLSSPMAIRAGMDDIILSSDEMAAKAEKYKKVFDKFLRNGANDLSHEEAMMLRAGYQKAGPQASMNIATAAAGGYTVPTGFMSDMDVAMKPFMGVVQAGAQVITTNSGENLPWPTANDTSNVGRIITEGGATNVVDPSFGSVSLGSYIYTSDIIKVSLALLQDTAVDLQGFIRNAAAERVGRIQNQHFTTGTGVGQPKGVLTAATQYAVAASQTQFTFDELSGLKYSVNKSYRDAPGAGFMVADSTLNFLTKMKDGENRPLFLPSSRDGEPDRVLNKPVYSNSDMADLATGVTSVAFGDFSKYKVRNVSGDFLARVEQPYITNFEVAFIYFRRTDANLIDAGTRPIKFLKQA